jgi:hypothetical protein
MATSEEELIQQANEEMPEERVETVQQALEAYYMNGTYDDITGDVESPYGHVYRLERWLVTSDSQGFTYVSTYETDEEAKKAFDHIDWEYSRWDDEDSDI